MHDNYPIPGIKQSYRRPPGRRTVVLPVLMGATMLGIISFFFWSEPVVEIDPASISEIVVEDETATDVVEQLTFVESSVEKDESAILAPVDAGEKEEEIPEPIGTVEIEDRKFTPWLSPLALDGYIRKKNEGFEQTFWQRGHWIKAVEGRWAEGNHEFRIAYEPIPNPDTWQWQYRVNQTQSEFGATIKEMSERGYKLHHTQSYERPDGSRRFQGVWQREIDSLQSVARSSTDKQNSSR